MKTMVKAEDTFFPEGNASKVTEFEYLRAKVLILEEQVVLMSKILNQNNLSYKAEYVALDDISKFEDLTWHKIADESEEDVSKEEEK